MTRSELMARVAARKSAIESEKADLQGQLSALREKFERLKNMTSWAEIDLDADIPVGTAVRYGLLIYECIKAHKKTLLRAPTNLIYWKLSE